MRKAACWIAALAGAAVCSTAFAQDVEPNDTKAQANVVAGLVNGNTVSGNSTTATGTGLDTFLVSNAARAAGIYRNQFSVGTGFQGKILGRNLTNTADATVQTATTTGATAGIDVWYDLVGANAPANANQVYYQVNATGAGGAYAARYTTAAVTPAVIPSGPFADGQFTIMTVGQTTVDTEMVLYNQDFDIVYYDDDSDVADGAPSAGLQSFVRATLAPGTYYIAISAWDVAVDGVPQTDTAGARTDFARTLVRGQATATAQDFDFQFTDPSGTVQNISNSFTASPIFSVYWATFTVVSSTPGACCFVDGSCQELSVGQCTTAGGSFQGGGTACNDTNCPRLLGACCRVDGSCVEVLEAACLASGGTFQGAGSFCQDVACPQPNGRCCLPDGSCREVTEEDCDAQGGAFAGDFTRCDNSFTQAASSGHAISDNTSFTESMNVAQTGNLFDVNVRVNITHTWIGDLDIRITHNATTVTLWDNSCGNFDNMSCVYDDEGSAIVCASPLSGLVIPATALSAFDGMDASGSWDITVADTAGGDTGILVSWAIEGTIAGNPCPQPSGACCYSDGSCADSTREDCDNTGGTYQGDGTDCAGTFCAPPPTGACCYANGTCSEGTGDDCNNSGGSYQGDGTVCGSANCPQPTGACCFEDGSCTETSSDNCSNNGGSYQGDDTICDFANCPQPPTGSCCVNFSCVENVTQTQCGEMGGSYNGDGSGCFGGECEPSGACCFQDGSCFETTNNDCAIQGGDFQGSFTSCGSVSCPGGTGACCYADGSCSDVSADDCANSGGSYNGDGTSCGSTECPQPPTGSCCVNFTCTENVTEAQCANMGGSYNGDGSACNGGECEPNGACCFEDGHCEELTNDDCAGAGGDFQGSFTTCGEVECPQPRGACCIDRCNCQVLTEADCIGQGGVYGGDGVTCASADQCFANPACPCDVNGVDGLDSQDFFDFIDLFFATDPAADINCADGVDSQDYFDFVECFFGGVCNG